MAKNAVIAALSVDLTANTAKFNKAMGKSKKRTNSWAKDVRKSVSNVAVGFVAARAVQAAAFAAMYIEQSKVITQLSRMSGAVNSSVEDLSAWQHAGKKVNIESEKMADIFKDVSDKIGDLAITGGGGAVDMFKKLNLNIQDFVGLSAPEQLTKIGTALEGVATQSEKIFFLEALAGDASQLLPLLDNGAKKLIAAQEEAKLFGLAISSIDAAKVKQATDSTDQLGDMFSGLTKQLTIKFAPAVDAIAKRFGDVAKEAGGVGNVADKVFNSIVRSVGFVTDAFRGIQVVIGLVKLSFTALATGIAVGIEKLISGFALFGNAVLTGLIYPFKKALELIAPFNDTAQDALNGLNKFADGMKFGVPEAVTTMADAMKEQLSITAAEVQKLATTPMPSTTFKNYVAEIVAISQAGAEIIAANSPTSAINSATYIPITDKLQKDYESVLSFLDQREMAETNAYIRRQEIINEYFDSLEFPNEEMRLEKLHNLKVDYDNKALIAKKKTLHGYEKLIKDFADWEIKTTRAKALMVIGIAKSIAGPLANESKKAFKIMKVARIAEAVMNTYAGINQALASLPPPASFVAAGVIGAMGIANVAKIKKQQFRSSSAAASVVPISGGSFKSSSAPAIPTVEEQDDARNQNASDNNSLNRSEVTYNIYGTGNDGKRMVEEMREEIANGAEIIPADSRNAQTLQEAAA